MASTITSATQREHGVGMSVRLMAGLTFGTILTMVLVPVLYAMVFRIPAEPSRQPAEAV